MKKQTFIGIFLLTSVIGIFSYYTWNKQTSVLTTKNIQEDTFENVIVSVNNKVPLGPYEPMEGVYLGAYVQEDTTMPNGIEDYEQLVGYPQTFHVFYDAKGKCISPNDLLHCMAHKKTPYIKLLLSEKGDLDNVAIFLNTIQSVYQLPVFIELFPITQTVEDPVAYKKIYEKAYEMIQEQLDYVTFVWSVDRNRIYDMPIYYPGDGLVDWVGINIDWPTDASFTYHDLGEQMDFWYQMFANTKPLMISSLAISHFSLKDNTYIIRETMEKLTWFYNDLCMRYPRLKAILYSDVDMKKINERGTEDYRISSEKDLCNHIRELTRKGRFLNTLRETNENQEITLPMEYKVKALVYNGKYYLDRKTFMHLSPTKTMWLKQKKIVDTKGNTYYLAEDNGEDFTIRKQKNAVY